MIPVADFCARMGMSPERAAEFAADIARLAEQAAPLVSERLRETKE